MESRIIGWIIVLKKKDSEIKKFRFRSTEIKKPAIKKSGGADVIIIIAKYLPVKNF